MNALSSITWILPAHNEAQTLPRIIARLDQECQRRASEIPLARAIIVENGSSDSTWDTARTLEKQSRKGFQVLAVQSPDKGIGHAYALGIKHAVEIDTSEGHWVLASAADLPFGMSDVDQFLQVLKSQPSVSVLIGSKRHPQSQVVRTFKRTVMTMFFYLLRRILLGSHVRDSQGTFCLPASLADFILDQTRSRDFFFSTEFIYRAERRHLPVIEVPIVLEPEMRGTTVHALRDGLRMLLQILKLRFQG